MWNRVFDERWTELSAELDLLEDPNTTHPLFAGQRDACDFRRDEKIRLENVALEYKMKCLRNKVLASRAQVLAQCYQKIRAIRDDTLTELNRDFCQVQKERRQFKSVEPHYIFQFEADRARQVENQVKYNKEVSLLSGIAKYRGFPSAPPLQGVLAEDLDADFQAMRVRLPHPLLILHVVLTRLYRFQQLFRTVGTSLMPHKSPIRREQMKLRPSKTF